MDKLIRVAKGLRKEQGRVRYPFEREVRAQIGIHNWVSLDPPFLPFSPTSVLARTINCNRLLYFSSFYIAYLDEQPSSNLTFIITMKRKLVNTWIRAIREWSANFTLPTRSPIRWICVFLCIFWTIERVRNIDTKEYESQSEIFNYDWSLSDLTR